MPEVLHPLPFRDYTLAQRRMLLGVAHVAKDNPGILQPDTNTPFHTTSDREGQSSIPLYQIESLIGDIYGQSTPHSQLHPNLIFADLNSRFHIGGYSVEKFHNDEDVKRYAQRIEDLLTPDGLAALIVREPVSAHLQSLFFFRKHTYRHPERVLGLLAPLKCLAAIEIDERGWAYVMANSQGKLKQPAQTFLLEDNLPEAFTINAIENPHLLLGAMKSA